ncbi:MAG: LysR family transcriptional regulator [Asticcacaulis sp.]
MDRLRAYEVFAAVIARGSFTRAADALDTSPANVTRYINDLEAHLGVRLINRTSRKLSLTESGQALYDRTTLILDDVAEAESIVSAGSLSPSGRLRINAPLSFGILHLAPLWPAFMAKYPNIDLDISLADRVVDLVEEGFDMGIRISRGGSGAYVARKLAVSRNILCAAPTYLNEHGTPRMPADLSEHRCILNMQSPTPDVWSLTDKAGNEIQVRPTAGFRTNNGDTARASMLAGGGINWQPAFLVAGDLKEGTLVEVLPDYRLPDIDILAIYPSRRHLSAKVRVMVDFLSSAFKGVPDWER